MPAYEYVCKDCSKEFVVFLSIREFEISQESNALTVRAITFRKS